MFQIKSTDNKILFHWEKSELFPDFRSVLKETMANQNDFKELYIDSENLDTFTWNEINLNYIRFKNCSMVGSQFINCHGVQLSFENCDITSLKIKKSKIEHLFIHNCIASKLSFRNTTFSSGSFDSCECNHSTFYQCDLSVFRFYSCNLRDSFFYKCNLDESHFTTNNSDDEKMQNIYFVECSVKDCEMLYVENLSQLYFWETNIRDITFMNEENFIEVINPLSKIIYAINSDVVWWKPYSWAEKEKGIFRGSLKQFKDEVYNNFPTTDLYPDMNDYEIQDELIKVITYLELWQ